MRFYLLIFNVKSILKFLFLNSCAQGKIKKKGGKRKKKGRLLSL